MSSRYLGLLDSTDTLYSRGLLWSRWWNFESHRNKGLSVSWYRQVSLLTVGFSIIQVTKATQVCGSSAI